MTEQIALQIGAIIKKHRKDKGWGHVQLEEAADLAIGHISKLESGKYKNPSMKTLVKIANALGINMKEFTDLYE